MQALNLRPGRHGTPIRLVQITDLHLMEQPESILRQVNTDDSLRTVLNLIKENGDCPDLLLATGDLAQDGSSRAYKRLLNVLSQTHWPIRCLPGNHDDPLVLQEVMGACAQPVTDIGAWRIISLNSTIPGTNAGHISGEQFDLLESAIAQAADRYLLIALHHNPIQNDSSMIDTMMLDNSHTLFRRLDQIPRARVVLWGHVHQVTDKRLQHMRLLSTPSTCFQFGIRDGHHIVDDAPPGYRWIKLYDDGSLATGVQRLSLQTWATMKRTYQTCEDARA